MAETNLVLPSRKDLERMARRRFQAPAPRVRGNWWVLDYWQDDFQNGELVRKRKQEKLAPEDTPKREVERMASEFLRPLNQGLQTIGAATEFKTYVEDIYIPTELPLLAKSTQDRYEGIIKNYLIPSFGSHPLRDMTPLVLQKYLSGLGRTKLSHESQDKIRDVLASILGSAKKYDLLVKNPRSRQLETPRSGPDDLVFQSPREGKPMRDNNILSRHIKPAGRIIGCPWLNWRCLRTSHATWLKMAGADVKDAQAQMRHSRASTTLDIYQQFVPESQRRAVDNLTALTHHK